VRDLTVCAPLAAEECEELAKIRTPVALEPRRAVFDEGEAARHVFTVTAGALKIFKLLADGRRQITGFLFPGDFLGLAFDETYAYGAETVSRCALCRFPRRGLEALLERFPHMEKRLLHMASHELAAAQEQMMLLGRKGAAEKVASFLLMLSERAARRGLPESPISVPMTRYDIGDYLGLTTETVSRIMSGFRRDGLIVTWNDGKVELADRDRLRDISASG